MTSVRLKKASFPVQGHKLAGAKNGKPLYALSLQVVTGYTLDYRGHKLGIYSRILDKEYKKTYREYVLVDLATGIRVHTANKKIELVADLERPLCAYLDKYLELSKQDDQGNYVRQFYKDCIDSFNHMKEGTAWK